jgi:hypothetical protein
MDGDKRGFLQTTIGRVVSFVIVCLALAVAAYFIIPLASRSGSEAGANERTFADASFNPPRPFQVKLQPGMQIPVLSPLSQKQTGYPAELCYWTKVGTSKSEPTAVILNETIGKEGPTFCPDCGRLVVPHNPTATGAPPPTQAEYLATSATTQPSTAPAPDQSRQR